jgi:hypothetical protein
MKPLTWRQRQKLRRVTDIDVTTIDPMALAREERCQWARGGPRCPNRRVTGWRYCREHISMLRRRGPTTGRL